MDKFVVVKRWCESSESLL